MRLPVLRLSFYYYYYQAYSNIKPLHRDIIIWSCTRGFNSGGLIMRVENSYHKTQSGTSLKTYQTLLST